jgi:hypothetical protein
MSPEPMPVNPDQLHVDILEPQAMVRLTEILTPLDESARHRVLAWAMMRFGAQAPAKPPPPAQPGPFLSLFGSASPPSPSATEGSPFRDAADLFAAASPDTQNDAVLVACYWLQVVKGLGDFEGASVNAELRAMGRHHPNITRALGELENRKPQYVIVVRKGGRSAQARKVYRLTQPAIRAVEEMVAKSDVTGSP